MRMSKVIALTLIGAMAAEAVAGEGSDMSDPVFVCLRPGASSFWHTAPGNVLDVPVRFPENAQSATLTVSGVRYRRVHEGIEEGLFRLTLPAPTEPGRENVYDLVLTFDDGTERRAKVGLVQSFSLGPEGATRCLLPAGDACWGQATGRAVLPIPQGVASITVNGVETDTGLNGDRGWFALGGLRSGTATEVSFVRDGQSFAATLLGNSPGALLFLR